MIKRELLLAIISGCFFGIAAIFMKIALAPVQNFSISSLQEWEFFIFSLPFVGFVFSEIIALVLMWTAFSYGKVVIVAPVVTAFTILVSLIGALTLFNESISILRAVGIVSITIGAVILKK